MTAYRTNRSAGRPGHPTQFAGAEAKPEATAVQLTVKATIETALREMADMHPVHYRLYMSPEDGPVVICVQEFDYRDYEPRRFLNDERYSTERGAANALFELYGVRHLI